MTNFELFATWTFDMLNQAQPNRVECLHIDN
jgi:hypothetical protein